MASTEDCATEGGGTEHFLVPFLSPWDELFASGFLGVKTMFKKSLQCKLHGSKILSPLFSVASLIHRIVPGIA